MRAEKQSRYLTEESFLRQSSTQQRAQRLKKSILKLYLLPSVGEVLPSFQLSRQLAATAIQQR
jgi:hypothetical protein